MNYWGLGGFVVSLLISLQVQVRAGGALDEQAGAAAAGIGLEEVIREVTAKSDDVKSLSESVKKSKEQIREQWANALPTVSATLFAGRAYGSGYGASSSGGSSTYDTVPATIGDVKNIMGAVLGAMYKSDDAAVYKSSVSITQPIYTFGKIGTAVKVANYYDSSAQLSYKKSIQDLQLTSLDAFTAVVIAEKSLSILDKSVDRKKELSEFLSRNFSLGSGSKANMLATNADLELLWPEISNARQLAKSAKMRLNIMMGRESNALLVLDTTSFLQSLIAQPLPSKDEAMSAAIENRSDIQALDYLKMANDGGVKIYKAMTLPSIAGQFTFGTGGTDVGDLVDIDTRTWQAGVALQWNIFDGFASNAKANQYKSDSRKLDISKQQALKYLEIAVESALTECSVADSSLIAVTSAYQASQEAYRLTNDNFKQGDGQFADLQLAEERLFQGELMIMNARCRQIRSRAALLVTMGKTIISMEGK